MLIANKNKSWLLFFNLIAIAIFYLILIEKTTANFDRLTTDFLFWGIILWLLWQKRNKLKFNSDPISIFLGFLLLGIVLFKTLTLFDFESSLLPLLPISATIALTLIASGIRNFKLYYRELFFSWFLFFPEGVIGHFIDSIIFITVLNAKVATYFLYYLGFETVSYGNEVILNLPEIGNFKAIVDYPCAGLPMIILIFKISLLLISSVNLNYKTKITIPLFSIFLGFLLGVVRVCILTLLIPKPLAFQYWHGDAGSQIFSTLAILIFAIYSYWILQKDRQNSHVLNVKC